MKKNANLHTAKKEENDEFYTLYEDIEKEMINYRNQFKDKVVYCNCDDYKISNFVKYFKNNFHEFGLKELIATSYNPDGNGTYYSYNGALGYPDELEYNGDFRSLECLGIMLRADIIITNPPFSLFREYIDTIMKWKKQFIILGNMNAITYKEIYPLIKDNKIWWGVSLNAVKCSFQVPDFYEGKNVYYDNGMKLAKVNNAIWFTNLVHDKRNQLLTFTKTYNPDAYPKYENYNGIDIAKVCDIPVDYKGVMGVPITFLGKYNPKQFEIVGFRKGDDGKDLKINDKYPYFRVLIKYKE